MEIFKQNIAHLTEQFYPNNRTSFSNCSIHNEILTLVLAVNLQGDFSLARISRIVSCYLVLHLGQ
jgi:hypothetical protein